MKYEMFGFIFRSFFLVKSQKQLNGLAVYNVFKENIIVQRVLGVTGASLAVRGRYNHSFRPQRESAAPVRGTRSPVMAHPR